MSTPAEQIKGFIAKFDPEVAKVIRDCRSAMRKRFPTAFELVYDNYNFLVFGFGPTVRPSDCIFSIAAASNGLGLAFIQGAKLPDPDGLLQGNGKQTRFVRLPSAATLSERGVDALIKAAVKQSKAPMPGSGKGQTIIRSVSAKQRPRRKTPHG